MNKFCCNCGAKLKENADFCVECGVSVNKYNIQKPKPEGKGCGIASLVLGIISLLQGMFSLFIFMCLIIDGEYFYIEEKIIFAFFFLISPTILSIIGLPLGISSINKYKSGINLTGLILNIIAIGIMAFSIAILTFI